MVANPSPRLDRIWRHPGLFGLSVVAIVAGLVVLSSSRSGSPPIPNPNGYDDLVRAGASIKGAWPKGGDWKGADLAESRAFVDANQPALALARRGLGRDGLANFADSQDGFAVQMDQSGQIRSLSRLMLAEARIAEKDGRFGDAARVDFEILEAGQVTTQGALAGTATLGWVIQWQALEQLRRLRDHLSARELRPMIRHLERLDQRRTPVKALVDRWERWQVHAFPWWHRLPMWLSGMIAQGRADQPMMLGESRNRAERSLRYLLIEWAIHVQHEETGRWPRSIAEMVPSILTAEPIDSATKRPLIFPANPSGELADDLSTIGQADRSTDAKPRP